MRKLWRRGQDGGTRPNRFAFNSLMAAAMTVVLVGLVGLVLAAGNDPALEVVVATSTSNSLIGSAADTSAPDASAPAADASATTQPAGTEVGSGTWAEVGAVMSVFNQHDDPSGVFSPGGYLLWASFEESIDFFDPVVGVPGFVVTEPCRPSGTTSSGAVEVACSGVLFEEDVEEGPAVAKRRVDLAITVSGGRGAEVEMWSRQISSDDPSAIVYASADGGSSWPDMLVSWDGDADPTEFVEGGELPSSVRLDFLFELCDVGGFIVSPLWGCFRDAHFVDPDDPSMGSGPFPAGRGFHVRHGFPNDTGDPLPGGFTVRLYVGDGDTYQVFEPDYSLLETTSRCGPGYRSQVGSVECQQFVHELPDGLRGTKTLWAVWEAPCRWWVDEGLWPGTCLNPDAPISRLSSHVESPFEDEEVAYTQSDQSPSTRTR